MFKITPRMVRDSFDSATYERGKRYFEAGRLVDWELTDGDENNIMARGRVRGSEGNVYRVELTEDTDDKECIDTDCSCPVGSQCKHGVTLALRIMHEQARLTHAAASPAKRSLQSGTGQAASKAQPSNEMAINRWLDAATTELTTQPTTSGAADRIPVLWLRDFPLTTLVDLAVAKRGKTNTLGRAVRVSEFNFGDTVTWGAGFTQFDSLLRMTRSANWGAVKLEGAIGATLLQQLPAICLLLRGPEQIPMRLVAARRLTQTWELEAKRFQLTLGVEGLSAWHLVPVEPPYFFDPQTQEMGPLECPFPTKAIQRLQNLPPIPEQGSRAIWLKLSHLFGRNALQLPVELPFEQLNNPTPQFVLSTQALPNGSALPLLRWQIAYGPWVLEPAELATLPKRHEMDVGGISYSIHRDGFAEQLLQQTLEDWVAIGPLPPSLLPAMPYSRQRYLAPAPCRRRADYLSAWSGFIARLEELDGWQWIIEEHYQFETLQAQLHTETADGAAGWFDLALDLQIEGQSIPSQQLVEQWLEEDCPDHLWLALPNGRWAEVDCQQLKPLASVLSELNQQKDGSYSLPPFYAGILDASTNDRRAPKLRALRDKLRNFKGLSDRPSPKHLAAELRPYQLQGFNWLMFLQEYGLGGILADDMGLGKTLQALALLQQLKNSRKLSKPALIVAPTSLLGNWLAEAQKFAPRLKTLVIHGQDRSELFATMAKQDVIITTYGLVHRDLEIYQQLDLSLIILDEAQNIKNATTLAAQAVRSIKAPLQIALTGTPLENHLGELWAIMDFVLPGLLGGATSFNRRFRTPIEKHGNADAAVELAQRVAPFMLRRTKNEVAKELPNKTTTIQYVELEGKQRQLYETIRLSMQKKVQQLLITKGLAKSRIEFLDALLKLRQACIDPRLVKLANADKIKNRAKLEWLQQTLPEMIEEGRKILIFSQFTSMLDLVAEALQQQKITYCQLTGQTRKRQEQIDSFQHGDRAVFLISLKAGGSGLNLTAADVVIHLDPWWNPAVEAQATDRAYRIGQDKPVFVYKLVAKGTVEEKIQAMQADKQALADSLFDNTQKAKLPKQADELLALFA